MKEVSCVCVGVCVCVCERARVCLRGFARTNLRHFYPWQAQEIYLAGTGGGVVVHLGPGCC